MGMNESVDEYVCRPSVGIYKTLEGVFIQFEIMDQDSQQGTGKSHTVPNAHAGRDVATSPLGKHSTEVLSTEADRRDSHGRAIGSEKPN
jgi:hypothetical protein